MEKIIIDLEAKTDKALKEIEKLNDTINQTGKNSEKSLKSIDDATKKTAKSTGILSKGFKGVGLALKGLGLGLVIKIVDKLTEAFSSNQQIVDVMNTAFETVSIVVKQVTDVFSDVFGKVSDATGGFDALGKVLGGALSIAVNSIGLTIQGITLGIQKARLAWEQSFLGGKDKETIKELNLSILETQKNILETGERIKNSGKQIADNFVEAVGEVGTLAVGVADAVTETIDKIDVKQAAADAKRLVKSQKNFELLALQQQRLVEQYDLQAEKQRQIRDDESKSIAERIKANEELGRILLQQNEAEKKTVDARISAVQQEIALKGNTVELSNQLYDLQTERLAIDAKVAGFQSEQLTNINSLKREELDLTKAQTESENTLLIEKKRFNAEQINDSLLKLQRLKEIDAEESLIEVERLKKNIDNTKKGTQARIDAEIALDEFNEQVRQKKIEREKEIVNAELERKRIKASQIQDEVLRLEALKSIDEEERNLEQAKLQALVDNAKAGTQAKIDAQVALDEFNEQSRQKNLESKIAIAEAEGNLEKQKVKDKQMVVNAISQFADAETGIGKALLIAKQALALKETLIDIKRITFKGTQAVAEAGVNSAQNISESSKIGFPQNLITIAGAIAQGVSIIGSVKKAVSKTKASVGGMSASTPSIARPSASSKPPAFNVVGASSTNQLADAIGSQSKEPVKAYVVANDVSTAQSMDRNIVEGASI